MVKGAQPTIIQNPKLERKAKEDDHEDLIDQFKVSFKARGVLSALEKDEDLTGNEMTEFTLILNEKQDDLFHKDFKAVCVSNVTEDELEVDQGKFLSGYVEGYPDSEVIACMDHFLFLAKITGKYGARYLDTRQWTSFPNVWACGKELVSKVLDIKFEGPNKVPRPHKSVDRTPLKFRTYSLLLVVSHSYLLQNHKGMVRDAACFLPMLVSIANNIYASSNFKDKAVPRFKILKLKVFTLPAEDPNHYNRGSEPFNKTLLSTFTYQEKELCNADLGVLFSSDHPNTGINGAANIGSLLGQSSLLRRTGLRLNSAILAGFSDGHVRGLRGMAQTLAHEFAHSLGASHDSAKKSGEVFVMSRRARSDRNDVFSEESVHQFVRGHERFKAGQPHMTLTECHIFCHAVSYHARSFPVTAFLWKIFLKLCTYYV